MAVLDCSNEDLLNIHLVERYCILNKCAPGLRVEYGEGRFEIGYKSDDEGGKEKTLIDVIERVSISF